MTSLISGEYKASADENSDSKIFVVPSKNVGHPERSRHGLPKASSPTIVKPIGNLSPASQGVVVSPISASSEVMKAVNSSGRTITYWSANLNDSEKRIWLDKAIAEFESHGRKHRFFVTDGFRNSILLQDTIIFVTQVNKLLDLIPSMARDLDEICGLKLGVFSDFNNSEKTYKGVRTYAQIGNNGEAIIAFNECQLNNPFWRDELYHEILHYECKQNWNAPVDMEQLMEYIVTHEMGHIYHFTLSCYRDKTLSRQANYGEPSDAQVIVDWEKLWCGKDCLFLKMFIDLLLKLYGISWNVSGSMNEIRLPWISRYGDTKNAEWFAEVSGNTFCGGTSITNLGRAMLKFINVQSGTKLRVD